MNPRVLVVMSWCWVLSICLSGAAGAPGARSGEASASAGFWPTDRLIQNIIRRFVVGLRSEYELTDEQARQVERQMMARWPAWLRRNRPVLQPLFNEMIEARMAPEPPDPDFVADWANRALPIFADFQRTIEEANDEFRDLLTPSQRAKFDAQRLAFAVQMQVTEQTLRRWKRGGFAPREWWRPPVPARRRRSSRQSETAEGFAPINAWQAYVESFITRYGLDAGQARSARSILAEISERARAYEQRTAKQVGRLERQLRQADRQTAAALRKQRDQLRQPLVQLFRELKQRLEGLLTAAQRGTAATQPAPAP